MTPLPPGSSTASAVRTASRLVWRTGTSPGSLSVSSSGTRSKTSRVVVGGPPALPFRYVAHSVV